MAIEYTEKMKGISVNISDIESCKCDDGTPRRVLDSGDKIIRWIKYQFQEQQRIASEKKWTLELKIDLSYCVLYSKKENQKIEDSNFNLLDIIKIANNLEENDFFERDGDDHNKSKRGIKYPLDCKNSIFYIASFQHTTFHENAEFDNTIFFNYAFFTNCHFTKYTSFKNVKFNSLADFGGSVFDFIIFDDVTFSVSGTNFSGCTFKNRSSFSDIQFSEILPSKQRQIIRFRNCVLKQHVVFKNILFTEECSFEGSNFEGICEFLNCTFQYPVSFNSINVQKQLIFYYNENTEGAIDNKMTKVSFVGAMINGYLEFMSYSTSEFQGDHISINNNGLLRFRSSSIENLNLKSLFNTGTLFLEDNFANINNIELSHSINRGVIELESTQAKIKNRKTARILKDSAYKSGNTIDALHYKAEEMRLYKQELGSIYIKVLKILQEKYSQTIIKIIFALFILMLIALLSFIIEQYFYIIVGSFMALIYVWTPINKWVKQCFLFFIPLFEFIKTITITERILLWLNTISNNYGLSWLRGIIFTISSAFLFYTFYFLSINTVIWTINLKEWLLFDSEYWKSVAEFLWLPDGLKELKEASYTSLWSYIWFIIGKILIAYGIYQIISAFRKYGK